MKKFMISTTIFFALYGAISLAILFFGVYEQHPQAFKRLWTPTQVAIQISAILASTTAFFLYFPSARRRAVESFSSQGRTMQYAVSYQKYLLSHPVIVSYWFLLSIIAAVDFVSRSAIRSEFNKTGTFSTAALPLLDLSWFHWSALIAGGTALSGLAVYYYVRIKFILADR